MSKKPYDFLVTDKEPLLYLEKSIVRMDDGFLTCLSGKDGKEILAPASYLVLMLGAGTSITQEAAIFCATNDLHVAFARGGCNIHSFFMSGRYQSPESLMAQARLIHEHKFHVAKLLLEYRLRRNGYAESVLQDMRGCTDITALTAWEGRWAQTVYKHHALKAKQTFTRDFDGTDLVNAKLNVTNNALYSICTAICLACGLHPSLGFIHGFTRRGGFAFDLADVFKLETTIPISFDSKIEGTKTGIYALSNRLRDNNSQIIRMMVKLCLLVGSGELRELEEFCASGRS